jgi:3',5'-cyclic AMP phosphodiesterase CpdA
MKNRVSRIAHLSDVHMLEPRRPGRREGFGAHFLSLGRPLDPEARRRRLRSAIAAATRNGADHIVVSGDLTETGALPEFESFADTMLEAGIDPERVTLVPGNHDAYASANGWRAAVQGPLRPFARTSADTPGKVVELGNVCFMPLDVTVHQSIARSGGALTSDAALALERRAGESTLQKRPLVLVQHHPPFPRKTAVYQWIDGLAGWARLMALLVRTPNLYVLHGHLHYVVSLAIEKVRVFGAPAIVEDEPEQPRVRLYDVVDGELESVGLAA